VSGWVGGWMDGGRERERGERERDGRVSLSL